MPSNTYDDNMRNSTGTAGGPNGNRGCFKQGIITRALPGQYSYSVETDKGETITCKSAATMVSNIVGVKDLSTLSSGTPVILWTDSPGALHGVILCALPTHAKNKQELRPRQFSADPESGVAIWSSQYFEKMLKAEKFKQKVFANNGRPFDINAGDWGMINEHGVFLGILGLTAVMRGSQQAAIEVHTLDDLVRLRSGQYQHFSAFGEQHIYNDGGNISIEICGSSRQHEVSGKDDIGEELFERNFEISNDYKDLNIRPKEQEATLKRRFQMFFGHLGLMQMFVCKPENGDEKYSREADHQGLLHMNVAESGYFGVTTAAGMALTRDDIIPIPKKLKEPWDPEGDKAEDGELNEPKEPYKMPPAFKGGTHLVVRDMTAWARRNSYQRFDELETDWHTPEADDLFTPDNNYDKTSDGKESNEEFQNHSDRRAGIYVNPDGSVTIMDAAGSQIILDGKGGIQIGGAGNTTLMPGGSAVIFGGDDAIIRAKNSVDISSTDKDVRLKAEKNLHAYSNGGILLESAAENVGHGFSSGQEGEDVNSSGIVLKAENSSVFVWGKEVILSGIEKVAVEAIRGASQGVRIIGDIVRTAADRIISTTGGAVMQLTQSQASLHASGSATVGGGSGLLLGDGGELWIPLTKDGSDVVTPQLVSRAQEEKSSNYDSRVWLGTFDEGTRPEILFTFRNSEQYATTDFELYQLSWQILIDKQPLALRDAGLTSSDSWQEIEVNGTMPFPGKDKFSSNVYIVLSSGEVNVDENGKMKNRDSMTNEPQFDKTSLNEYKVTKR
jgi:uncharacterized protein (DUF2345 family)